MDTRREAKAIFRHFSRYHTTIGEATIYFRFDADNSSYDRVYDEGYRRYNRGVRIPILWVDQMEATEDYAPEGRRPTQRLRYAVSAQNMYEAGVSVTEVHGNRLQDTSPSTTWRRDRINDLCYYDGRYWEISGFQIRGRVKGEDVIIGVTAIETFRDDDMILDFPPGVPALPASTPTITPYGSGPYGSGPYGGTP